MAPDRTRAASLPELKRVIVAFGNRVIMDENLDRALRKALGAVPAPKETPSPVKVAAPDKDDIGRMALKSGLPLWGVLIGLRHLGRPTAGMIAQPYLGERFYGDQSGAFNKFPS